MRIISKFRDVYDLQQTMFDEDRVWHRETQTLSVNATEEAEKLLHVSREVYPVKPSTRALRVEAEYNVTPVFIAGEVHWLHSLKGYRVGLSGKLINFKSFDMDKMFSFLEENGLQIRVHFFDKNPDNMKASIQDSLAELKPKAEALLSELRVPLAIVDDIIRNKNDTTKLFSIVTNFGFHDMGLPWQEIEPNLYRLHQLIEQYLFGVIGTGEPETITTSDKDRLLAHGFDFKKSFRNMGR